MATKAIDGGLSHTEGTDITLGIDPSLSAFALAAVSRSGSEYGVWVHSSTHRGVDRLMDISMWLSIKIDQLARHGLTITDVAMEDTVLNSYSASKLGELAGVVKVALKNSVPGAGAYPLRVPPATLKKFATGSGKASKQEVMSAVAKKWGPEFTDDNMADAFVLARMARGVSADPDEEAILVRLRDPKFRDVVKV